MSDDHSYMNESADAITNLVLLRLTRDADQAALLMNYLRPTVEQLLDEILPAALDRYWPRLLAKLDTDLAQAIRRTVAS